MAEDDFARGAGAEVDVGGLPSHGVEQAKFLTLRFQINEFDARAVRAEAAHDPASAKLHEGVETAHGTPDDGLIENFRRPFVFLGPITSGRDERLGFARDLAALPFGDSNIALMPEAAQSGDAASDAIAQIAHRHEVLDGVDGADLHWLSQRG